MSTPGEGAIFHLNQAFAGKYLLWSLTNEQLGDQLYQALHGQVCECEWRSAGRAQHPDFISVLRLCYSIKVKRA